MTTISSRAFNQEVSRARKAAEHGPVVITNRGKPAQVLLSFAAYQRLSGSQTKIADLLALPVSLELELLPLRDLPRPADFS